MYKYYIEILHKNNYIPKLLNKIKQMVKKNWLILLVCKVDVIYFNINLLQKTETKNTR